MPGPTRVQRRAGTKVPFPIVVALLAAAVVAVLAFRAVASGPSGTRSATSGPSGAASGTSPSSSPSLRLEPLPSCRYGSELAARTSYRDWRTTVLDTELRLPASYVPPRLVSTARAGFGEAFLVRRLVIKDLAALREAAEAAGYPIGIEASYRSHQQQKELFDKRKAQLGYDLAVRKTARPGHSEHQLGTTLDFKTKGAPDVDQAWGSSPTGMWVAENGWRFGFVQSYPRNKHGVTCYSYEPWHFRYVGRTMAASIHDSGLTLREFLWNWDQEHGS